MIRKNMTALYVVCFSSRCKSFDSHSVVDPRTVISEHIQKSSAVAFIVSLSDCRRFKRSPFYSAAPGNIFRPCFQNERGNLPFRTNRWIKFQYLFYASASIFVCVCVRRESQQDSIGTHLVIRLQFFSLPAKKLTPQWRPESYERSRVGQYLWSQCHFCASTKPLKENISKKHHCRVWSLNHIVSTSGRSWQRVGRQAILMHAGHKSEFNR